MITINSNTRYFNIPGSDLVFGVVADSDAERKIFQCPRYVGDNLDLAACFIRINYRNANGKTDFYLVDDMVIDGDNITFSWLLSPKVTEYRGQVKFVMCAVGPDLKLKWHTTQGTGQVMEGLEPDNSHVESQTADVVAQLIAMVEEQTTAVENVGASQVTAVNAAAKTAQSDAVTAIETAGKNTRDSIPADYTALSDTVDAITRTAAPGIVCSAAGEVITLSDASDNKLRGLRIFGRSTQNGTPTPENPVEIVSVGGSGAINTTVCGKNLIPFPYTDGVAGATLERSGITWTVNVDGSITANGTANVSGGSYFILNADKLFGNSTFSAVNSPNGAVHGGYAISAGLYYNATTGYLSINIQGGTTLNNKTFYPQIEFSMSCTDYEPYRTRKTVAVLTRNGLPGIPVTSGGNYTDENGRQWICDEVDFERGVYVQRIGLNNLTGKETYLDYVSSDGAVSTPLLHLDNTPFICSHFTTGETTSQWANKYAIVFDIATAGCNTMDEFVAFVTEQFAIGTPIKIVYILETTIETPLSETELAAYRALHTNKPNTTILNDSGAYMSVDYTADTKLYIDNKIKEALK